MSIHLSHLSHGHGWVDCIDTDLVGAKLKSCHPEIKLFSSPYFDILYSLGDHVQSALGGTVDGVIAQSSL